jgi:hypothetical protein
MLTGPGGGRKEKPIEDDALCKIAPRRSPSPSHVAGFHRIFIVGLVK